MSMMDKLNFLGLQGKQLKNWTFSSQTKCYKVLLKKFDMDKFKEVTTSISTGYYLDLD